MAEGGISEPGLEETPWESQECSICFSEFKDPRMLDCSHRFCLKCLQELKQAQSKEDNNIVCPLCRRETVPPEDGVGMLPSSLEGVTSQKQDDDQGLKVMCQSCDEENEAICRCIDCEHYLCQECQKAHQRLAALRSHKIATLKELGSDGKLKDFVPKCKEHPDQDLCLYCNPCDALICNTCTASKHKKSSHFFASIDTAYNKCRQEINEAISQTDKCIQEFTRANPQAIDHSRHRLATMLSKTKIQISLKAEKEIAKIRQKEQELRQEAEDIVEKRDQQFTFAITAEKIVNHTNKLLTTASSYELLQSKMRLTQNLRKQSDVHKSLDINHWKSFLGFKESQDAGELGTLLLEEKWEKKETLKMKGTCLTVNSTGCVILGSKRYLMFSNSETGSQFKTHSIGFDPTVLAVNNDDQLIVLSSPVVRILDHEYRQLRQFTPGKEANINSTPTCLAVDGNNLIAVGYKAEGKISFHNQYGSLLRTLAVPNIDRHLTISNQRLIYTDNETQSGIWAVDNSGNIIFTYMYFTWYSAAARGLACDDAGDIYVAYGDEIRHFSPDGKHFSSFTSDKPRDVKFTPEGNLLVLHDDCVCLYTIRETNH